jgi:ubiquinol-cytochrome c reductase cytochrome b subunit
VWGAIVIPGLVLGVIFLMPFLGHWKLGHRFNIGLLVCILAGAAMLTYRATVEDQHNVTYQAAAKVAETDAARARVLAESPAGIPSSGAVELLRNDPLTRGPKLFAQKCAGCHRYDGHDGTGQILREPQSASDLKGFASRQWLAGLLNPNTVSGSNYFGGTKFRDGKMAKFVHKEITSYSEDQQKKLQEVIAAVSAEAQLKAQLAEDQRDTVVIQEGRSLMKTELRCTECHQFHKPDEEATAPDLTGYGSRKWLISFISNPAHPDFYGERSDRMPAFGAEQILSEQAIGLIADWLRGSWYEPAQ